MNAKIDARVNLIQVIERGRVTKLDGRVDCEGAVNGVGLRYEMRSGGVVGPLSIVRDGEGLILGLERIVAGQSVGIEFWRVQGRGRLGEGNRLMLSFMNSGVVLADQGDATVFRLDTTAKIETGAKVDISLGNNLGDGVINIGL